MGHCSGEGTAELLTIVEPSRVEAAAIAPHERPGKALRHEKLHKVGIMDTVIEGESRGIERQPRNEVSHRFGTKVSTFVANCNLVQRQMFKGGCLGRRRQDEAGDAVLDVFGCLLPRLGHIVLIDAGVNGPWRHAGALGARALHALKKGGGRIEGRALGGLGHALEPVLGGRWRKILHVRKLTPAMARRQIRLLAQRKPLRPGMLAAHCRTRSSPAFLRA